MTHVDPGRGELRRAPPSQLQCLEDALLGHRGAPTG
jgi:hypothetical protein